MCNLFCKLFIGYRFKPEQTTNCQLSVTATSAHLLPVSLIFSLCTPLPGSFVLLQIHKYFVCPILEQNVWPPLFLLGCSAPKWWNSLPSDTCHVQSSCAFKTEKLTWATNNTWTSDFEFCLLTCPPPPPLPCPPPPTHPLLCSLTSHYNYIPSVCICVYGYVRNTILIPLLHTHTHTQTLFSDLDCRMVLENNNDRQHKYIWIVKCSCHWAFVATYLVGNFILVSGQSSQVCQYVMAVSDHSSRHFFFQNNRPGMFSILCCCLPTPEVSVCCPVKLCVTVK